MKADKKPRRPRKMRAPAQPNRAILVLVVPALVLSSIPMAKADVLNESTQTCLVNFEEEEFLDPPQASVCKGGVVQSGTFTNQVVTSKAHSGTQSWKTQGMADTNRIHFPLSYDLCDIGSVEFWFYSDTSSSTNRDYFGFRAGDGEMNIFNPGPHFVGVYWQGTAVKATVKGTDGNGRVEVMLGTFVVSTWNHVQIKDIDCGAGNFRFASETYQNAITLDGPPVANLDRFGRMHTVGTGNAATQDLYIDDILATGYVTPPPVVSAATTAAVTSLAGFDVDPSGATAIARVDGGATVQTVPAGTLNGFSTVATNCNRAGGVAALSSHVSYFHCDAGNPDTVTSLRIRGSNLQSPDQPTLCTDAGFCVQDVTADAFFVGDLAGDQDKQIELATVQEFPFDYSENINGNLDYDTVWMAWGVTTTDGRAGVVTYSMHNNEIDDSDADTIIIDPSGNTPNQLAICQDGDGQTYMYAASFNSNVVGARVDFTKDKKFSGYTQLLVSLTKTFSGTSGTAGAQGVDCGEGRFAVLNADKLTIWNRGASQPHVTISGLATEGAGVAMSADGQWVAYVSSGSWRAVSATNGTEVASGVLPSGAFQRIEMQGAGANIWIATSTTIARYEVWPHTTGSDTAYNPDFVAPPPAQSGPGDVLSKGTGAIGSITPGAGNAFMGFILQWLLPLLAAAGGYLLTGGRIHNRHGHIQLIPGNPIVILCAAYAGLWASVVAFGMSPGIPILLAVFAVALIVWGAAKGRAGGA